MRKFCMVLLAALFCIGVSGIVRADETVVFPFFQHGWGCTTFWSIVNTHPTYSAVVTLNLLDADGSLRSSIWSYVSPGRAWLPDTGFWDGAWYTSGDRLGFGNFEIIATTDCVHLWACVYGTVTADGTSAGYTLVLPQNPYGAGD